MSVSFWPDHARGTFGFTSEYFNANSLPIFTSADQAVEAGNNFEELAHGVGAVVEAHIRDRIIGAHGDDLKKLLAGECDTWAEAIRTVRAVLQTVDVHIDVEDKKTA